MSLFEKIKKTLSCIGFVAREIWESAKGYFALGMLSIVVGAAVPLVLIQILGSIVDRLMTGDFQAALGGVRAVRDCFCERCADGWDQAVQTLV